MEETSLWQLSDTELLAAASALQTRMRQDYYAMLGLMSEIDTRGVAGKRGYTTTAGLLLHTLRITRTDARHQLARAEVLHDRTTPTGSVIQAALPLTAAALARGEISSEHVDVIRKTLKDLPQLDPQQRTQAEELMLSRAAEDDPKALERFGGRARDIIDPDGPPPVHDEPKRPDRELRRHIRRDGWMELKARLDPETARLLEMLLKQFEKSDPEVPDTRGYAERAGDAFLDVLKMAANCPDLPVHNGVRTEVAFTISLDQLQRALDDVVLPGESYLTARDARRIACDCHVLPAVMGGTSKPLDVAVPSYVVPAHMRRALVLRDRGCTFPSCDRPASVCDAHHVWHVRHEARDVRMEVEDLHRLAVTAAR